MVNVGKYTSPMDPMGMSIMLNAAWKVIIPMGHKSSLKKNIINDPSWKDMEIGDTLSESMGTILRKWPFWDGVLWPFQRF